MPTLPPKSLGKRIGGAREGVAYLAGQNVTKRILPELADGVNRNVSTAEQKMRFYCHKIGHLLFPKHILDERSVVTRPSGIFVSSKFRPGIQIPLQYVGEVKQVYAKLHAAGISCDLGSKEPNYLLSGGHVLFYEVTSLDPAKVLNHLAERRDLGQRTHRRVRSLLSQYDRAWSSYCEQTRVKWERTKR